jgi:hypothetical protein
MKNLTLKNIGIALLAIIIALQFIPTEKNAGDIAGQNHLSTVAPISEDVNKILIASCYDCHSNHTEYPWYNHIQPVGLWLNNHVREGKDELNFSEFATYKRKRQLHKLDEVVEMLEKHEMPLSSYTLVHTNAKLTAEQETLLMDWAKQTKALLKDSIPIN